MRVQVRLHFVAKAWIEDVSGVREGGRGCWGLPSLRKSPMLKALFFGGFVC